MAVISLGCYEGGMSLGAKRHSYLDFFESAVVIGGVVSLIMLFITALEKPKQLLGRVYVVSRRVGAANFT